MLTTLPTYMNVSASTTTCSKGLLHVVSVGDINALSTGNTGILTVPTGYSFVLEKAIVRLTSVVGTPTVGDIAIINSTDTVDIIAATTVTGLTAVNKAFPLGLSAVYPVIPAGKVISAKVAAAYSVATVVRLSVDIIGYLV